MLSEFVGLEIFALMVVFARVGGAFMIMPVFGEAYISARIRLLFALVFAFIITPVVGEQIPNAPQAGATALVLFILAEITIGVFLGVVLRVMVAALSTAGGVISLVSGFANALLFNPAQADQGSLQSVFLSLMGVLLILVTDLHHVMLMGVVETYRVFPPAEIPMMGDLAETIARGVADSFALAMKLASPFIVLILLFFVMLGLIARMMPQLQVFFIAMPLQILIGLYIFLLTLPTLMMVFLEEFAENLARFFMFQ